MRKLVLSSLIAVLLSGCATAHQQTEQEKALVGDWICHVKPAAKSPLPVEHFDYVTYHADQTVLLRGISQIDTKEGWMRYLLQAKAKWQASDGKLSYDLRIVYLKPPIHHKSRKLLNNLQNLKN